MFNMAAHERIQLADGGHRARKTADGYLVTYARVARSGVQAYDGACFPKELGFRPGQAVRVYRPEDEVFSADSMKTYAHRPITDNHPSEQVTADNWSRFAKGQIGQEVVRDGDYVQVPLILMDSGMIAKVEGGKAELSMGYSAILEVVDGVTPQGEAYDAIQRSMLMNHLAVVDEARGGPTLKIMLDAKDEPKMKTRHIVVDGASVEVLDSTATVIETAMGALTAQIKSLNDSLESKNGEIATLTKAVADAKDVDLSALLAEHVAVCDAAEMLGVSRDDMTGRSAADIRKMAVVAKLGDATPTSEAGVQGAFETMVALADKEDTAGGDLGKKLTNAAPKAEQVNVADTAYDEMQKRLTSAWKKEQN